MDALTQFCPICHKPQEKSDRYPNYVCRECFEKASDFNGQKLLFSNIDISGGYRAKYQNTNEEYKSHICYIDGIKCYVGEAKFGGIVIEKIV